VTVRGHKRSKSPRGKKTRSGEGRSSTVRWGLAPRGKKVHRRHDQGQTLKARGGGSENVYRSSKVRRTRPRKEKVNSVSAKNLAKETYLRVLDWGEPIEHWGREGVFRESPQPLKGEKKRKRGNRAYPKKEIPKSRWRVSSSGGWTRWEEYRGTWSSL